MKTKFEIKQLLVSAKYFMAELFLAPNISTPNSMSIALHLLQHRRSAD